MKLIVGLGNPGKQYQFTRHNLGFFVIDRLAGDHSIAVTLKGFDAIYGRGRIENEPVLLAKPQTFMNRSGSSVSGFFEYFKIEDYTDVIVVHDDLDLPFGVVRLKADGGHGGHKGLLSTIEHLGRSDFLRVRMGIGRPVEKTSTEDYVLSRFSDDEMNRLPKVLSNAVEAIDCILSSGIQAAMNRYNVRSINNFIEEV
ncbi:MAG: aminoacyl-tRNA hydrolase [Syntrophales bacterium]|nr:aminoacyl-tRNA hydrolase [Syntrophales bacterium]